MFFLSKPVWVTTEWPSLLFFFFFFFPLPLSQRELSARLAGLILDNMWDQIWAQFDVGSSVAAHFVVVGGWKDGQHLNTRQSRGSQLQQLSHSICFKTKKLKSIKNI